MNTQWQKLRKISHTVSGIKNCVLQAQVYKKYA